MSPNDWIGRRVRVTAWELMNRVAFYLRRTREHGDSLEGTVTHVEACGGSDDEVDVWVQIDGLAREYIFGPSQLEVLPLAGASRLCNSSRRVRCADRAPFGSGVRGVARGRWSVGGAAGPKARKQAGGTAPGVTGGKARE